MSAAERLLDLPTAAVYLAEAEWRLDNPDAADQAADRALSASVLQGSNHQLLTALSDYPAVASRRLDATWSGSLHGKRSRRHWGRPRSVCLLTRGPRSVS